MKPQIVPTTDAERALPWGKCLCGGRYCLYADEKNRPHLVHTLPWCERFEKVEDTDQAIAYSQANRGIS